MRKRLNLDQLEHLKIIRGDKFVQNRTNRYNLTDSEYKEIIGNQSISIGNLTDLPIHRNDESGRYILLYAQNDTPIHEEFFKSLLTYIEYQKEHTEMFIFKGRYKNPTGVYDSINDEVKTWDSRLTPYLIEDDLRLAKNLVAISTRIQPTASYPISGFNADLSNMDGVIFHPKQQYEAKPVQRGDRAKGVSSTGAITKLNYSWTKAGTKSKPHHIYGAVIVEVFENGEHALRYINAETKTGNFYDISAGVCRYYTPDSVTESYVDTIVAGDSHFPLVQKDIFNCTLDQCNRFKAKTLVAHDLADIKVGSHWNMNNPHLQYIHAKTGQTITSEGQRLVEFIKDTRNKLEYTELIAVESNHDLFLNRWIKEQSPSKLPADAKLWYYLNYETLNRGEKNVDQYGQPYFPSTLLLMLEFFGLYDLPYYRIDESLKDGSGTIEIGQHGHIGPNGARGNAKNLSKVTGKRVIGHGHSPCMYDNTVMVGVNATKEQSYAKGPSSWMYANCFIYPNGKRTLIFMENQNQRYFL